MKKRKAIAPTTVQDPGKTITMNIVYAQNNWCDEIEELSKNSSDFLTIKNRQGIIEASSTSFAQAAGFQNPIDYLGATDFDLKTPAVALASEFAKQDITVIENKKPLTHLTITKFDQSSLKCYLSIKTPYKHFSLCRAWEIKPEKIIYYLLQRAQQQTKTVHICYECIPTYPHLTVKESEVLFLISHGKHSKDIATLLSKSFRTIQHATDQIRYKTNCSSVNELREFCALHRHDLCIPASLLPINQYYA